MDVSTALADFRPVMSCTTADKFYKAHDTRSRNRRHKSTPFTAVVSGMCVVQISNRIPK